MTELKFASVVDVPKPSDRPTEVQWYLPEKTFFYAHHSAPDGGKFPATLGEVPEGGIGISTLSNPDYIRHRGRMAEHWYRVRKIGPDQYSRMVDDKWVCLERTKGEQGGHWRGSPESGI